MPTDVSCSTGFSCSASRPWAVLLMACALAACTRTDSGDQKPASRTTAARAAPAVVVHDVFERDARAIVGIAYPPGISRYPQLAQALLVHAGASRAALGAALAQAPTRGLPYELSLRFSTFAEAPNLVAVVAEQELYTGGAGSIPSRKAFVWLPGAQRLLGSNELIAAPAGWAAIERYVASTQATSATGAPDVPPIPREVVPLLNSQGRIVALRLLSNDATTENDIEVPAAELKAVIAPALLAWLG